MEEPTAEQMRILRKDILSGLVMIVEVEHYKRLTDNLDKSYDANKHQAERIKELEVENKRLTDWLIEVGVECGCAYRVGEARRKARIKLRQKLEQDLQGE